MGVKIGSTAGYMYMDMWVLASIIQLGTFGFCRIVKDIPMGMA